MHSERLIRKYIISEIEKLCNGKESAWSEANKKFEEHKRTKAAGTIYNNYQPRKAVLLNQKTDAIGKLSALQTKYKDGEFGTGINMMPDYTEEYNNLTRHDLISYEDKLRTIREVQRFGGSGYIHGSIVDITPFTHLYLNIEDSSIIPYFAKNIVDKYPYSNVSNLLYDKAPTLLPDYNELQKSAKLPILNKVNCNFQYFPDTSVYNPSNKLRAIQYMFDNNVIRTWYDDLIKSEALTSDSLDYIDI